MLGKHGRLGEERRLDLHCSLCGKPVAGRGGTDVMRSLLKASRCQCSVPKLVAKGESVEEKVEAPLPTSDPANAEHTGDLTEPDAEKPKELPSWQSAVLANLPEEYEVLSMIGEGGMGTVWKVRNKTLDQIFAIKVLRSWLIEDNNALNRFEQEAEATRFLSHLNLATVHSFGMGKKGAPYLVMDYLDGKNLAKILKEEGHLEVPRATDLFIQIAGVVGHAHSKDILHRDIKPTNIIVECNQEGLETAKLVDFGIAKVLPSQTGVAKGQTRAGEVFGSPPYMSPEQCLGGSLDGRSDIYAFGCVMYESLCGNPPFSGDSPVKTMLKHTEEEPLALRKASKDQIIPQDLEYLVMHCLEKNPDDRYQSMQDLESDLRLIKENQPITHVLKAPPLPTVGAILPDSAPVADPGSSIVGEPYRTAYLDSIEPKAQGSSLSQELEAIRARDSAPSPSTNLASYSSDELDAIGVPKSDSSKSPDRPPHRPLELDSMRAPETDSSPTPDRPPYRSLELDSIRPPGVDSSQTPDRSAYRSLELDSIRALEPATYDAIDPDLYRLYREQSQSLKAVCAILAILLVCFAAAYVNTFFHTSSSGAPLSAMSDRDLPDAQLINQELVSEAEKGARSFIISQQFENAAPLLEISVKSQQHLGKSKTMGLTHDQEGLGRCYMMLGNLDRSSHWYELAMRSYEDILSKDGAHFNRNSDWAMASACAKDYADVLTKLNRIPEAQALEKKWSSP
jgi:serine/threonine protein kinase